MDLARLVARIATTLLLTCAPLAAWAGTVELTTSDGVTLHAEHAGKGEVGVVLVHGQKRSGTDWKLFAEHLSQKGFSVLTLDLRGHGASKAAGMVPDEEWTKLTADVAAGVAHLRAKGAEKVAIVGAQWGANIGLAAAAADAQVETVVLLSPSMSLEGAKASEALATYGERPVLLAVAESDKMGSRTVKYLAKKATGPKKTLYTPGEVKGAEIVEQFPEVEDVVIAWLGGAYGGDFGDVTSDVDVDAGETSEFEATGKRFGE